MTRSDWRKTAWGWTATDERGVRWTVRGPVFAKSMYWVYRNGDRFAQGTADNPVSFSTAAAAKTACERASNGAGR